MNRTRCLPTESIQGASLPFQGVNHVHGCHSFATCVFSVSDCITDHILQEYLQDSSSFFVDESRDTLDTSSPGQTTDGRFGDPLDVVSQDLSMTLGTTFPEPFSTLSSSGHDLRYSCSSVGGDAQVCRFGAFCSSETTLEPHRPKPSLPPRSGVLHFHRRPLAVVPGSPIERLRTETVRIDPWLGGSGGMGMRSSYRLFPGPIPFLASCT